MKFILRVWLFLALVPLTVAYAQQPVFRIGVLDADTGPAANGARLAVQEINSAGGVRGADGTFFQLELIVQPSTNLENAVAALRQSTIIAAIGPTSNADVANGLAQLQSLNVPVLVHSTDDSILVTDTTDRLFRSRAAQILKGQALADYVVKDLGLTSVAVVQLDVESTDSAAGFSTALQSQGITPQFLLLQSQITDLATTIIQTNPQLAAVFGGPDLTDQLLTTLRQAGWSGRLAYNQADIDGFGSQVTGELLNGILATTTWPFTARDAQSDAFLGNYVRAFGEIPGPIAAASYDAVQLLAVAIGRPGDLQTNLRGLDSVTGVQGLLRPALLSPGETSNNVAVVQFNSRGVPQVAARYAGGVRLQGDQLPTPAPAATATPEGVVATIIGRAFQNVRSGPSTQFDVLGRLNENEQVRVIGANASNTWIVIDFRGQQGWLSVPLLDIFGDLNSVPIVQSPPTPTPAATSTPTPPQEADIIIESANAVPSPIIAGQSFSVNVVVRNIGNTDAPGFAIAATFPPNDVFAAATIPGLARGQAVTATLSGTLTNTGFYTVVIVADLNNQVAEGPGEANNGNFIFSYAVDKVILRQTTAALNPGDTLDLEGNLVQGDVNWNGTGNNAKLDALFNARIGIINNVTLSNVHWDLLNPGIVNQTSIPRTSLNPGTIIGVLTADGNRGVLRVDNIVGDQLQVTLRVYQN
jgi:branched-chain amino acid transport system substrate-binding protein